MDPEYARAKLILQADDGYLVGAIGDVAFPIDFIAQNAEYVLWVKSHSYILEEVA